LKYILSLNYILDKKYLVEMPEVDPEILNHLSAKGRLHMIVLMAEAEEDGHLYTKTGLAREMARRKILSYKTGHKRIAECLEKGLLRWETENNDGRWMHKLALTEKPRRLYEFLKEMS